MANQSGSIEGRLTMQGKPAPDVEIVLFKFEQDFITEENEVARMKTDKNGNYIFPNLPANHYWLKVIAPEYVSADKQELDLYEDGPGRRIIVASGSTVKDADMNLILGGAISGQIRDADEKPVVDEEVKLYRVTKYGPQEDDVLLREEVKTNKEGIYKIAGIPPGQYLVGIGVNIPRLMGLDRGLERSSMISGPREIGMVGGTRYFEETFYPGVKNKSNAKVLSVTATNEMKGINFSVGKALRAYTVSGRVIEAETGKPISKCGLIIGYKSATREGATGLTDYTDENGNFQIEGFLPGSFYLSANLEDNAELYCEKVQFVISNIDLTGLELKAHKGITMSGRVVIEGRSQNVISKLTETELQIHSELGQPQYIWRKAKIDSDGSFIVKGLSTGKFTIALFSTWFDIIRIEYPNSQGQMEVVPVEHTVRDAIISLSKEDLKNVRLILAYHGGVIRGHVDWIGKSSDAQILLQAGIYSQRVNGGMSTVRQVDADGNFEVGGLEPGVYKVIVHDHSHSIEQSKTINVTGDTPTEIAFTIDLSKRQ
jgi:hypothetical protein